jgi:hypothetical protein
MGRLVDAIEWAIPEPREFIAGGKGVAWRFGVLDPQVFYRADEGREWAVPSVAGRPAFLLDEFALLSRGTSEQRKARAGALAREWGSPLTLCGICGKRHNWDRVRPRPRGGHASELADSWWNVERPKLRLQGPPGKWLGDAGTRLVRVGQEFLDDWLVWANVINALRRVYVATSAGLAVDPLDVALFWPGPDAAAPRVLVAAVVNQWLLATCVSPALALPEDPPGAPPLRVVRIGSVLAWLGWVLREELTSEVGAVGACPECGMTFRLRRAGVKSRELCALHYDAQSKRDERARAADQALAEEPAPPVPDPALAEYQRPERIRQIHRTIHRAELAELVKVGVAVDQRTERDDVDEG